ncbi:MAG TPA: DNA polymerase III subunit beta [Bacteroidetes bacterium]|jgi:DNA polymerase III subunit beta|nr:DNA polymerase III subunit beta [Bacteroidota bacterium]|tara:strand:+ start:6379 stop:7503 length:1125 start_codon:yes stop_codon:yes gene_type:complete
MKFIVNTNQLLNKLLGVSGTIVSKPVIPILDHFLFDIKDGKLTITATDLETSMSTSLDVQSDEDIRMAVPSKMCIEMLKALPNQPVTFTLQADTNIIELKSEFGRYKLIGQNADDFPRIPEATAENSFNMASGALSSSIVQTIFASGNDELRLSLTGVYVQLFKNNVVFVATDANRLVKIERTDVKPGVEASFILPKKALNLLKSSLPQDDSECHVDFNDSNAFFTFGDVRLICRLIDERYPDYRAVIPTENPNKLTVNRTDFLNSVKRISIFGNKSTNQINIKITGSELTISAEDIDMSNEAVERLGCDFAGEDMEIGFNSKLLIELLQNINTPDIIIELSTPNRAGIILPNQNIDDEHLLMLIMPMMIASAS